MGYVWRTHVFFSLARLRKKKNKQNSLLSKHCTVDNENVDTCSQNNNAVEPWTEGFHTTKSSQYIMMIPEESLLFLSPPFLSIRYWICIMLYIKSTRLHSSTHLTVVSQQKQRAVNYLLFWYQSLLSWVTGPAWDQCTNQSAHIGDDWYPHQAWLSASPSSRHQRFPPAKFQSQRSGRWL